MYIYTYNYIIYRAATLLLHNASSRAMRSGVKWSPK